MNIAEEKIRRNLPPLFSEGMTAESFSAWREKTLALYARECFGVTPPPPLALQAEVESDREDDWAGKAEHRRVRLTLDLPAGKFSFPVHLVLPKGRRPAPCVVYISFTPYSTAGYQPIEEVVDHGYAMAVFCYEDVTRDDGDFSDGLAAFFPREKADDVGKIGLWAYAAMRVLDYAQTLPEIDAQRIFVMGHSRLGKTALWAAAQDARFAAAISNDSGCSGAAVTRGKVGETVADITGRFPYWFCKAYAAYAGREAELPVEQYQLLACIAPRPLYVSSASEDAWADPQSEFLSAQLASPAWALLGAQGIAQDAQMPEVGGRLVSGSVGYHLRPGTHYLSRYDWARALRFLDIALL